MREQPVTPTIIIADQPSDADLAELAKRGFRAVVNLRLDGEPEQPLDTEAEGEAVRRAGMDYLHEPINMNPLTPESVETICAFLTARGAEKVLVHCRRGGRAAVLVLLHLARSEGWKPDELAARAASLGIALDGAMRVKLEEYLARGE